MDDALVEVGDASGYRHCPAPGCELAYYNNTSGHTVRKDRVTVRIGTKETEDRPVCYCFDHSWESIEAQLAATGSSDAVETITAHCRAGEDRCPEKNPQGSCCLGNVRRAIEDGKAKLHMDHGEQPVERPANAVSGGLLAGGGALLAAILASACCWLPLLLVALGVGGSAFAGFFEQYRWALLAGTALLLGVAYYFVWFRKEQCAPGEACAAPRPRLKRFNKVFLTLITVAVAGFAFFPEYVGLLVGVESAPISVASSSSKVRAFAIEGMTCEGCAGGIRAKIQEVPGVQTVSVSFKDKSASVSFVGEPKDDEVLAAIASAGYEGHVVF